MLNIKALATIIAAAAISTAASAAFASPAGNASDFGAQASGSSAVRVIDVNEQTRWVNVTDGEDVQFNVKGQAFTWHVSTYPNRMSFDLNSIAPANVSAGAVRVYVAPNPLYNG